MLAWYKEFLTDLSIVSRGAVKQFVCYITHTVTRCYRYQLILDQISKISSRWIG